MPLNDTSPVIEDLDGDRIDIVSGSMKVTGSVVVTGSVDISQQPIEIKIRDSSSGINFARVDSSGRVYVSVAPPTAPPTTTPVNINALSLINNTTDNVYTIPTGQTLHLQRFSGGGEGDNYTSVVELYYDPNGNGSGMTLIRAGYVYGNNFEFTLDPDSLVYTGNGTRAIRLRRRRLDGGSAEVAGFWDGYLE